VDSLVLDTVIGIVFVFATFGLLISLLTELIARFMGLRGEYLMRGLRSLVDENPTFRLQWRDLLTLPGRANSAQAKAEKKRVVQNEKAIAAALKNEAAIEWKRSQAETAKDSTAVAEAKEELAKARDETARRNEEAKKYKELIAAAKVPSPTDETVITKILNRSYVKINGSQGTLAAKAGAAKLSNKERRALPSYLSSRAFATVVVDLFIPTEGGTTNIDLAREKVKELPGPLRDCLDTQLNIVGADIEKLRTSIESWYDDHMARVSGWYKRHVRWISLVIGMLIVLIFNVNAVSIGQALYTDEALRESVVTQAVAASKCESDSADVCLQKVQQQIDKARGAGLPVGWAAVPVCEEGIGVEAPCSFAETYGLFDPGHSGFGANLLFFLLVLVGWTVMVLALLPGARFWFDALAKLGSLRSTGPKPASK
jgi:hypothetical protein